MKKLIFILFLFLSVVGFSQQNITIGKGKLEGIIYNTKSGATDTLLALFPDSLGQFKVMNVRNPVNDLDAVNLRYFEANATAWDSIVNDTTGYAYIWQGGAKIDSFECVTVQQMMDSLASLPGGHSPVTIGTTGTTGGLTVTGQELNIRPATTAVGGYMTAASMLDLDGKISVVTHDYTLTGNGTAASPLKVDTVYIVSKTFLNNQQYIKRNALTWDSVTNKPTLPVISNLAYDAGWNGNMDGASKNSIYDKIESLAGGHNPVTLAAGALSAGLTLATQELNFQYATAGQNGALKATDYVRFNKDTSATNEIQNLQQVTDTGSSTNDTITVGGLFVSTKTKLLNNGTLSIGSAADAVNLTWDTGKGIVRGMANKSLILAANGASAAGIRIESSTGNVMIKTDIDNTLHTLQVNGQISSKGSLIDTLPTHKKWVIFGDSFSNDISGEYAATVISKLGLTGTVTNAVAGHSISSQLAVLNGLLAGDSTYLDDFNILSLLVGVNNWVYNSTLGTRESLSTDANYAGYLKDFIETALTANPNLEIYIMTPPEAAGNGVVYKGTNTAGWTLQQMSILIAQICHDYSIQCIDLYSLSGFNAQTIPTLTSDLLHPNAAGAAILGNIVAKAFTNRNSQGNIAEESNITLESILNEDSVTTNQLTVGAITASNLSNTYIPYSSSGKLLNSPLSYDGADVFAGGASKRIRFKNDGAIWWGSAANHGQLSWDTNKAIITANSGNSLVFNANGLGYNHMTLKTTGNLLINTETDNTVDKLQVTGTASGTVDATLSNQFTRLGQLDGYINRSLTNGYIPYYQSSSGQLKNSPLYFDGTNIGLGGAPSVATKFHIFRTDNGAASIFESSDASTHLQFREAGNIRGYIGYGDNGSIFTNATANSMSIRSEADLHLGGSGNNLTMTLTGGKVGIKTVSPTAYLHIGAGTASSNTAPLKFTAGTNLSTPEAGAVEWDGTRLYITQNTPTRKTIAYTSDVPIMNQVHEGIVTNRNIDLTITDYSPANTDIIKVVVEDDIATGDSITLSINGGTAYTIFEYPAHDKDYILELMYLDSKWFVMTKMGEEASLKGDVDATNLIVNTDGIAYTGISEDQIGDSTLVPKWWVLQQLAADNETPQTLIGTSPYWDATNGKNAKITLTGATTITLANLTPGKSGRLTVYNGGSTSYMITFSGYTFVVHDAIRNSANKVVVSGSTTRDQFTWYYDGVEVFINGGLNFH